jgi:hypothetical protein
MAMPSKEFEKYLSYGVEKIQDTAERDLTWDNRLEPGSFARRAAARSCR